MSSDWQAQAQAFKDRLKSSIPLECQIPSHLLPLPPDCSRITTSCGLFSTFELEILALDATELRDRLASRQYKALEVASVYCKAAAVAHQATNCLMAFFPDVAMERARWLDEELARTGETVGPLHGLPVSLKDIVSVTGQQNTMGILSTVKTMDFDAAITSALRDCGAVFFAKTTCPQTVMHLETHSFLGPTLNPFKTSHTAGGSSGGESALLALRASSIGVGTDIGGSIRGPAALCGIYGFKPTLGRLPLSGVISPMSGQSSIIGTNGPIARSARDLDLFMSAALGTEPWNIDHSCIKMPWKLDDVTFIGGPQPKVGVMRHDGVVMPQPPMRRALQVVVDKLQAAHVTIVEVAPFDCKESWEIARRAYFTDGGKRVREAIKASGEPILPLTQWILDQGAGELSATDVIDLNNRRTAHQAAYHKWFASLQIDVLLCPPAPGPAPKLGTSKYWGYTSMFNVLDVPAGVFPAGLYVDASDVREGRTEFWGASDRQAWEAYSPEAFAGLPLGLQVVGRKWEDEKVVRAILIIDQIVHASGVR
ncbi:amidase signature domain-containing protein [Kockovaella imperatae]|uniref:amidase n=1 Tax=Kockovaella imperatae TaxID=4999 RepID=A0A1Y1UNE3_9TREE|nr:amidase signature domain-containing protein [Kockovaella imperatae]ORX39578.1 amidase signature domain-containing protein [Kockovaella imperatae]